MLACVHASRQDLLFRIRLIWLSAHAAQDNDAKPLMIDGTRVTRQRRKTPNDRWWWRSVLDPITSKFFLTERSSDSSSPTNPTFYLEPYIN
jgi:hypothetical protein